MSCEIPTNTYPWITEDLLESIVRRDTLSKAIIKQFTVRPATETGENYSSQLLRVRIDYTIDGEGAETSGDQTLCKFYVIKASLGEKLVRSHDVFAKEIQIFTKIIPAFEQLFRNYDIDIRFGPRIHASSLKDSYLILTDLTADNYQNIPRQQGLNGDQLRVCLKLLSRWHAASVKFVGDEPSTLTEHYNLFLEPHVRRRHLLDVPLLWDI